MSIEDEIKKQKELQETERRAKEQRRQMEIRVQERLRAHHMDHTNPVIVNPTSDLKAVIDETISSMIFCEPKHILNMSEPVNIVYARWLYEDDPNQTNEYSFDVKVGEIKIRETDFEGDLCTQKYDVSIWFFRNGTVAYAMNWDLNRYNLAKERGGDAITPADLGITADLIRQKIIEKIATMQIENKTSLNPKKEGGCYIATAIYGSYDCPEVWVLRRYRDFVLLRKPFGQLFVKVYYTISPKLVNVFGNIGLFRKFWKDRLDRMVADLRRRGVSDKPYND